MYMYLKYYESYLIVVRLPRADDDAYERPSENRNSNSSHGLSCSVA